MPTTVHFINVGQGNMTLLQLANGFNILYDCNLTNDNEKSVLKFLESKIGKGKNIDIFICSHRDADHMRGVKKVHSVFPIKKVWDTGVVGTTPTSTEYSEYMELRRTVGYTEVQHGVRYDFGNSRLRIMNAKNAALASNANAQSIVIKVIHRDSARDIDYASVLLTGDTDAVTWKDIKTRYSNNDISCDLLLASHHGSLTYFDDPADTHYYISHLQAKSPAMTIISVGDNSHGHPHEKALEFYEKHSSGSNKKNKICRTDIHGHIVAELKDNGGWELNKEKP